MSDHDNHLKQCRVCGLEDEEYPWGLDGESPCFEYCICCGTQFGYHDASLKAIIKKRSDWISSGAKWDIPKYKTQDWDYETYLLRIPRKYFEIL